MMSSLSKNIKNWVQSEIPLMKFPEPLTAHINVLLGESIKQQDLIDVTWEAYLELLVQTKTIADRYMPCLIIPLICTAELDLQGPTQSTLDQHLDTHEPPSLYVIDRNIFRYHRVEEKYIRPLHFGIFSSAEENVYTEYVTFRDAVDIKNNWEYTRFIQSSYFPKEYTLP